MRMLLSLCLWLGLVLSVSACSKESEDAPSGDAAAGRILAAQNCQSCHSIDAEGASPLADAPPFRDIVKRIRPEDLAEALGEGIQVSHSGQVQMPEMTFEPEQVDDLIAYLNSLQK